jgi:hypothetical protein
MMITRLLLSEEAVDTYLEENDLLSGNVPLEAILLQLEGTVTGQPAVLLIATVDGKKRVIKATLNTVIAAAGGLRSAAEAQGWVQAP